MDLPPKYVDGLYRQVLLGVKASNAIPSEEDDFHFHYKFNQEFRASADALSGRITTLLHQIQLVNNKFKTDDDPIEFNPLEENGALTDLVDTLLEDASKQIERFQKGEVTPATATAPPAPAAPVTTHAAISKPQENFEEKIDNSDAPFIAKLKTKPHAATIEMEDQANGDEPYHPYRTEISTLKYQPWQTTPTEEKREMIALDDAKYTWVDTEESLAAMIAELGSEDMLAIDLEHHSYRSYQGILCLMQISTWNSDWLVDTLALRSHLHALNVIFCDPTKLKVLHGADMDILWLQRDLGLYIVNMFDTGQAARCLQYPRFSLAYLLKTHCNVSADKQYQLADWRVRPLDAPLVKYAREDTRYLLYIYEILKAELLKSKNGAQNLLFNVYAQSAAVALSVYEKPKVPTSDDIMDICIKLKSTVGLETITTSQHHIFQQLYLWRDSLARQLDESTGFICPNAVLMKLMKGQPTTPALLFRLCNPVPPLVRKYAHELSQLIAREAAKEPASTAVEVPVPTAKVATTSLVHEENTQIYGFAGWKIPKRTTTIATSSSTSPFASAFGKPSAESNQDALEKVRQALSKTSFVVVGFTAPEPVPAPVVEAVVKEEKPKEEEYVMPKALSDNYPKLKKRKFENKSTKAVEASTTEEESKKFEGFNYAAASQQVEASKMNVEAIIEKQEQDKRKKQRYNPFVGVAAGGGKDTVNQKRGYNAPRSSTFR